MPDAAHDTLDLFDNTTLGWTVETPRAEPQPATPASTGPDTESTGDGAALPVRGKNFYLEGDRSLARGWTVRARDNIAAIRLSKELEESGRAPTAEEQARLLRFTGFGATKLAQNCFPLPGGSDFRPGWEAIGRALAEAVSPAEYAALQRGTQYAHYTPEPIIRALWRAVRHLGFTGGRVLEPGIGTGLFFALIPTELRETTRLTGIEYCPVTARIARLAHPEARIRCEDYTRSRLRGGFDLAIGNPPFADRIVRADRATTALGLRLHDYFIARSIARLRPGGIALFVTSTGTMDKASRTAREHIASMADLIGTVRLPEASMRATAGTDVVTDVLVFQRRAEGHAPNGTRWMNLVDIELDSEASHIPDDEIKPLSDSYPVDGASDQEEPRGARRSTVEVNEYFAAHPEMVLGEHGQRRGIYGPDPTYTCQARPNGGFVLCRQGRSPDTDREQRRRAGRRQEGQGRGWDHPQGCPDHPCLAAGPGCGARGAADAGRRPPVGASPGAAARRLFRVHPPFRADQPHRRRRHDRPRDRRGTRDPPPPQPRTLRRRPRLLAGRQHRGLRPRKRARPHGPGLSRPRHLAPGDAGDRLGGRRACGHSR
jgi:adenine-specific DNA methylase